MYSDNPIGVMQGRLLPKYHGRYQAHPVGYWQKEFFEASALGLDCIEFILDYNDAELNPLLREEGLAEILDLAEKTGVKVGTVCADYFMEAPLHHPSEQISGLSQTVLLRLLRNGLKLGLTDIVIPCVDQSSLEDRPAIERLIACLKPLEDTAEKCAINFSLETDLPPHRFAELLDRFDSSRVTVNYDIGNSAALGYDPKEELICYGTKISDIHIKDRKRNGGSVLLGTGDAQFDRFFRSLDRINYKGPFVMQAYRDDEGIAVLKRQLAWVRKRYLETDG